MTRQEKLAFLVLKGWQIYDWNVPAQESRRTVEETILDFVNSPTHLRRFCNINPNDLGEDYLILMPPDIKPDEYVYGDFFTISWAYNKEADVES